MPLSTGLCAGSLALAHSGQLLADIYAWSCLSAVIALALLGGAHLALGRLACCAYPALGPAQQLATCFHATYALCYSAIAAPATLYTLRLLRATDLAPALQQDMLPAFILFSLNCALYVAEGAGRAVVKR